MFDLLRLRLKIKYLISCECEGHDDERDLCRVDADTLTDTIMKAITEEME